MGISIAAVGHLHPGTAEILLDWGESLWSFHDFEGALKRFREAFDILVNVFGNNHPRTAVAAANVAATLHELGRRGEAIALLDSYRQLLPEGKVRTTIDQQRRKLFSRGNSGGRRKPARRNKGRKR